MILRHDMLLAALEFTSLSMLGWLAAAAVPWLVHRWFRRPQRTTSWAAVDLLLAAVRRRSRHIQLQQWLLLAIRTAVLTLVAVAAAGPLWRPWSLGGAVGASAHRIIVVDQSYSMRCENDDATRFDRAKQRAQQIVEAAQPGDAHSVIGWSQVGDNVLGRPTLDHSLALAAIDGLQPTQTLADLPAVLRAIEVAIDQAADRMPQIPFHEVVFLTDLCRTTWATDLTVQANVDTLAERAKLIVLDVDDADRDNLAILGLTAEPALLLRQQSLDIIAQVHAFGSIDWPAQTVELSIDGRPIETRELSVSAGGETEVHFTHRFVDEGLHTVEISLTGAVDCLPLDDRRWLIVNVLPQLRVACFAATPGAADDVARALAPGRGLSSADIEGSIDPQIMPLGRLSQVDLTAFAAVMLCNAADVSPREAAQLKRFVKQGGGLAVFLGQSPPGEGPLESLLPVQIRSVQGAGDYRFDPLDYGHPIVLPFRDRVAAGLLHVSINQYVRLQPKAEQLLAETVLAFKNGDPALVVDQLGLGRVAVMAIPCSLASRMSSGSPWSSFPVSPSFLPIVRETVDYLVGDRWQQQQNLLVGQPATCNVTSSSSLAGLEIRLPSGSKIKLQPPSADEGQVAFKDTSTSGVYSVIEGGEEYARLAVNLDTRESDLSTIDTADLPKAFTTRPAFATADTPILGAYQSFARTLLGGALLLLLAETSLAWLMGRGWE